MSGFAIKSLNQRREGHAASFRPGSVATYMKAKLKLRIPTARFHSHIYLVFIAVAWLAFGATPLRATTYKLGTTALLEGPAAGTDSVVLAVSPPTDQWTATTNASWLHLSTPNQSGTGSTNVIFSFDGNTGATRVGTLSVGSQMLTIKQAGAGYISARPLITLGSGLSFPYGVAVDGAGNVYIADTRHNAIKVWSVTSNTVTTLISTNLNGPQGVAVDRAGNVYIADTTNNAIKFWSAATSNLTVLVPGLNHPHGLAVDSVGNVYIADSGNNAIKLYTVGTGNLTTLVSTNLNQPYGVAVDVAGNVYVADYNNDAVKMWTPANSNLTTLVSEVTLPGGVAVDGAGNIYVAPAGSHGIEEWMAASDTLATIGSRYPTTFLSGVAVDHLGNVYIADIANTSISEVPYAFVDPTPRFESGAAGSDALPVVLPITANLSWPFAPTNDQPWLTIIGVTNGVVNFSFTSNLTGSNRTANISLLGQTIPITQSYILPPLLTGGKILGNGAFQFGFSNSQTVSFTVLSTTNLSLPLTNWTVLGAPSNIAPGVFQFTGQPMANDPQRFYTVRSP
jgi:streptogramin lyase